jgi:acyl carrier protein
MISMSEMLDRRLVETISRTFKLEPASISPDTGPDNTNLWDSVGHLTLILEIEEVFGVRFSSEEISSLTSVGRLQEAIQRHSS